MSGADIADVAKLLANPTAADVLDALLDGHRLSVSAIARQIGRSRPAVSSAVSALAGGGLVVRRTQGRTTSVGLAGEDVAEVLEALSALAVPRAAVGLRAVTKMQALRAGRTCYDHLAGQVGVNLADQLLARGVLVERADGSWSLPEAGRQRLLDLGIESGRVAVSGRRPLVKACLDWTERRPHVAGRLGAAICSYWLERGLVHRLPGSRALAMDPDAQEWMSQL
jgi:DNA-binding transcriptional ArsR family regulator